jgi:chromosome segregation ATPase
MAEINYHETIVIPNLYKKLHTSISENITLELNLQIEQAKNKSLIEDRESQLTSMLEENSNLKQQIKNIQDILNEKEKLKTELVNVKRDCDTINSKFNNEVGKYNILTNDYLSLKTNYESLQKENKELKNNYESLQKQNEELKKPKEKKKVKREEILTAE